jgi:hypothetical protein
MYDDAVTIENAVIQELNGDDQRRTLDFVAFLYSNGMQFTRCGGYWANQYYWCVRYENEDVCYILVNGKGVEAASAPLAIWSETSDTSDSAWYEDFPLDERIKEIAWDNVDICAKCSPGSPCYGGKCKTVFGRKFSNLCRCTFRFDKPDDKEIECVKKLIGIRKAILCANQEKDRK